MVFGSCRVAAPHVPPYSLRKDEDERGREVDALHTLAQRMRNQPREEWPDVLLMIGDQVYADEVSPGTRSFVESRRDVREAPGERVLDYVEYTRLYRESWGDPTIRWLLSTLSTAMIFDDHDVHDDWNISQAWLDEMRSHEWWNHHIVGALASYWVYQHLGNLAPGSHSDDRLLQRVKAADDGWPILEEFARAADRGSSGTHWSYCRDLGDTRVVVIDSRAGRVLEEGKRSMLDEHEWEWLADHLTGDFDHLLVATSLPWLLGPGMHYTEAWSEAVAGGAWGPGFARLAERARQAGDLEHWAAFQSSFDRLTDLLRAVAAGELGAAPASIVVLSGDVHHAYLFEVAFPRAAGVSSHVYQAVCSPYRNPLERRERRVIRLGMSRPFAAVMRGLAAAAGVDDPAVRWRMVGTGPGSTTRWRCCASTAGRSRSSWSGRSPSTPARLGSRRCSTADSPEAGPQLPAAWVVLALGPSTHRRAGNESQVHAQTDGGGGPGRGCRVDARRRGRRPGEAGGADRLHDDHAIRAGD